MISGTKTKLQILGVVPARSGSKGVKSKNLLKIGAETLIERSLRVASKSEMLTGLLFSTDDTDYASIAQKTGVSGVVMRPDELSSDSASSWDVVRHAVLNFEEYTKEEIDIAVLLQPTTPFRTIVHIDECVGKLLNQNYEAAMTIREVSYPIEWMFYITKDQTLQPIVKQTPRLSRRQDARPVFQPAGTVYATTRKRLFAGDPMAQRKIGLVKVRSRESINIDTYDDYIVAKAVHDEQLL